MVLLKLQEDCELSVVIAADGTTVLSEEKEKVYRSVDVFASNSVIDRLEK